MTALLITMGVAVACRIGDYILAAHNYKHNSEIENGYREKGLDYGRDFVFCQKYPIYTKYEYGILGEGKNTCEVIAIHNLKIELGMESTLSQTIHDMQMVGGMWLFGHFGSFPSYVPMLLKEYGIEFVDIFSFDEMTLDGLYIVSYWTKDEKETFYGIHTVTIKKQGDAYHGYNNDVGIYNEERELKQDDVDELAKYYLSGYYITNS